MKDKWKSESRFWLCSFPCESINLPKPIASKRSGIPHRTLSYHDSHARGLFCQSARLGCIPGRRWRGEANYLRAYMLHEVGPKSRWMFVRLFLCAGTTLSVLPCLGREPCSLSDIRARASSGGGPRVRLFLTISIGVNVCVYKGRPSLLGKFPLGSPVMRIFH